MTLRDGTPKLSIKAALRRAIGKQAGDRVTVRVTEFIDRGRAIAYAPFKLGPTRCLHGSEYRLQIARPAGVRYRPVSGAQFGE